MKTTSNKNVISVFLSLIIITLSSCSCNMDNGGLQAKVDSLQNELKKFTDEKALTEMRIAKFDTLDFDFYSNQKWDMFTHNHADNIKVYYPDGSITTGLYPQHIDQLTPMFVFA